MLDRYKSKINDRYSNTLELSLRDPTIIFGSRWLKIGNCTAMTDGKGRSVA